MDPEKTSNKKVLLVSNATVLGEEVVQHGSNLSKRMDAALEVLHLLQAEDTEKAGQRFRRLITQLALADFVTYTQLVGQGDLGQVAIDYAQERRNLLCVILYPADIEEEAIKVRRRRKFKEVTKLLNCPVVLYTDRAVYL